LAENIKKDIKSFYAYVKGKAKVGRNIGPRTYRISDQNAMVDSAEGMSQEFSKLFSVVFTKEMSGEVPEADWVYKDNGNDLCDTEITKRIVSKKLDRLRDNKAAGSDDLLPRFLNVIGQELVCPLVIFFKKVLRDKAVPMDWKEANVVRIFKAGQRSVASKTLRRILSSRRVTLTNQICEVLEAVVQDETVKFLKSMR